MKNILFGKKLLFITLLVIACVLIYQVYGCLAQYICVNSESMIMPYVNFGVGSSDNEFWRMFLSSDHAWFIFSFIYYFLERNLPELLKIHPQEAIILSSKTVLFAIYIGFLSAITYGVFKYEKNKILFPLGLLLTCYITLSALMQSGFAWIFSNDCWLLAYMLLPTFGILFGAMAEKFYVLAEKPSPKAITLFVFLFLCIAVSHEFYKFLLLIMLPSIYFLHHICFKKPIEGKGFLKSFALYVVIVAISVLNNFSFAYKVWLSDHIWNNATTSIDFHAYFLEFMAAINENVFYDNIIYYLFIFALVVMVALTVQDKDKNKRFFIYNSTLLFTSLLFFFCLIVGNDKYDDITILPVHHGLRFCLKLSLITIIYSCVGYLISSIKELPKKIYLFIAFSAVSIILFWQNFPFLKNIIAISKEVKINSYILEKVFVLNNKIHNDEIFYTFGYTNCFNDDSVLYLKAIYNSPYAMYNYKVYYACSDNDNDKICQQKMIDLAYEKFGYKFTEKELEDLDFSSLYKLNFQ